MDHHRDRNVRRALANASERPAENFDIDRWAQLVADGQTSFPTELTSPQRETLMHRVARLRRTRLLNFIARAIAEDIFRSRSN